MKLRGFRDDNVKMFDYLYIFIYIYIMKCTGYRFNRINFWWGEWFLWWFI
jgi:hypothetical protein